MFSTSFVAAFELYCGEVLENFVILSVTLTAIKPPVDSANFWIVLEAVLSASVADYLAWWKSFWLYLPLKIANVLPNVFAHIFME